MIPSRDCTKTTVMLGYILEGIFFQKEIESNLKTIYGTLKFEEFLVCSVVISYVDNAQRYFIRIFFYQNNYFNYCFCDHTIEYDVK